MKVLIADDDPVSRRLLESAVGRWGYESIVVKDGTEAVRILLSANAPKMAILDWWMPGIDGTQLCQKIRQSKPEPYTYIVLLTSKCRRDDMILGLEAGADDYIVKPFDPAELKVRLRTGERILDLQDQLIRSREALRDQATRDHLTGLLNRAAIVGNLRDELNRTNREGSSLGILIADVDHFKNINDTYGHQVGDQVLCSIASAMLGSSRGYDFVGRFGGEEFLIVIPNCGRIETLKHAERLRIAVSQLVVESATGSIRATLSLGATVAEHRVHTDTFDLVHAADQALYKAKRSGRNRVEFAETTGALAPSEPLTHS